MTPISQQRGRFAVGGVLCLCLLLSSRMLHAEEPVAGFLSGLYQRGYLDTANDYLDGLEAETQQPTVIREQIPYHRAVLLMLGSSRIVRRADQLEQLQRSLHLLDQFLREHPAHALTEQAQAVRNEVRLQIAQRRITDDELRPASPEQAASMESMREQVAELRNIFAQQEERFQQSHDRYPAYISQDQPVLRIARERILDQLIRARLDLAQCDYWEAHTYPVDHPHRLRLLTTAGAAYESIHQRYRSQVGGLYARLWQGKCYEELRSEQGVRLALGIYGEIIGHDGTSASLTVLRDRALLYRLICLNSPFRKDYQLVEMEAEQWLDATGSHIDGEVGLGIQWELCRALEFLSQDEKRPHDTRLDSLLQAQERIVRLQELTGGQTTEFEDFRKRIDAALKRFGF